MISLSNIKEISFLNATNKDYFFQAGKYLKDLIKIESKEQPKTGKPGDSCKYNLYFGFFFDGTRNNYLYCEPKEASQDKDSKRGSNEGCHSNVARLYDIYPGRSVPGVLPKETDWTHQPTLYQHFFKTYIPGVGTEFKQVGDSGDGFFDSTLGAAAANHGAERIVWGLIQAINNVHRFFKKDQLLINSTEANRLSKRLHLSKRVLQSMSRYPHRNNGINKEYLSTEDTTCEAFTELLSKLRSAIEHHIPKANGLLPEQLDPGIVEKINISIFGFSRGAAKARVFSNWLLALGAMDAQLNGKQATSTYTLGGLPFEINFIGIFDTVASVGPANTFGDAPILKYLDGHAAWADAEQSLKVDPKVRCVHLVSAHEVRRSFPLDSICVDNTISSSHEEIVYPGVHSDIGGGYAPKEQGKGVTTDGRDMLSRIPLLDMYRLARLSGVPLKLELASAKAQDRFKITPQILEDFNAYISTCSVGRAIEISPGIHSAPVQTPNLLTDIFREQRQKYIQWRLLRRSGQALALDQTNSFLRASTFEQNDLRSANIEFEQEVSEYQAWLRQKPRDLAVEPQPAGFNNEYQNEWRQIATWWHEPSSLPEAVAHFFDEHVHDSRAWFKLTGPDSEETQIEQLQLWSKQLANEENLYRLHHRHSLSSGLTREQREAAVEFNKTRQIPKMYTSGREPFAWARAGHLRYRKIYAGHDTQLISQAPVIPKSQDVKMVVSKTSQSELVNMS